MSIIDTSLIIERVSEGRTINENVCMISIIEFPMILEYAGFHGRILYPEMAEMTLALELQRKLKDIGRMKACRIS